MSESNVQSPDLQALIQRYCGDPESVYHTWFLGEERLKAFRTIHRGIQAVVEDIFKGSFPRDYRGSTHGVRPRCAQHRGIDRCALAAGRPSGLRLRG